MRLDNPPDMAYIWLISSQLFYPAMYEIMQMKKNVFEYFLSQ